MVDLNIILVALLLATNTMLMASSLPYISAKRKEEIVFDIAYSLVWDAERLWGGKSGHIKRAYVKAKLYVIISAMPTFRNSIIDRDKVENTIDRAIEVMHKFMNEGK